MNMLRILSFLIMLFPLFLLAQETGTASYYADKFQGKATASGELYDKNAYTAAHRTLPFGTKLKITYLKNKKFVVVKVNDRGPFNDSRVVDISRAAAEKLDLVRAGTGQVSVEKISDSLAKVIAPYVFTGENANLATAPAVQDSFFRVYIAKIPKKGFGVQVGAFKETKVLFEKIAFLNEKGYKNVTVHIDNTQTPPIYRAIIGPYPTQKEADIMQKALKKEGFKGLVITLEKL